MAFFVAWATALAPLVVLVSLRVGVALAALPAPFGDVAPTRIRAVLSVLIALTMILPRTSDLPALDFDILALGRAAIGEVLVGMLIGLTVRVSITVVETAGTLVGESIGLAFASSVDPTLGEESLPTTRLLGSVGVLVLFATRGHHAVIQALAATLEAAPPGRAIEVAGRTGAMSVGAELFADALRIAAPVVGTMLVVQLGAALVARSAPRVQVFTLSLALATMAGMLVLGIAAPSVIASIAALLGRLPAQLEHALGAGT